MPNTQHVPISFSSLHDTHAWVEIMTILPSGKEIHIYETRNWKICLKNRQKFAILPFYEVSSKSYHKKSNSGLRVIILPTKRDQTCQQTDLSSSVWPILAVKFGFRALSYRQNTAKYKKSISKFQFSLHFF